MYLFIKKEKVKKIPLTQGKFAFIDGEDFKLISQHKWYAVYTPKTGIWYANTTIKNKAQPMHRLILGLSVYDGWIVHHKNCNGLDNRKQNLKKCSKAQHIVTNRKTKRITSCPQYIGVSYYSPKLCFVATVFRKGKCIFRKYFSTPEEAAKARDKIVQKYDGGFAQLNFPI